MFWRTTLQKQLCEGLQDRLMIQPPFSADRQTLTVLLFNDRQHPKGLAVLCPAHDQVIGLDMVLVLWREPDAGTITEPEPGPFRLLVGCL